MKNEKEISEKAKREYGNVSRVAVLAFIEGAQWMQEEMKQSKKVVCYNCDATVEMVILDTMCPECKC